MIAAHNLKPPFHNDGPGARRPHPQPGLSRMIVDGLRQVGFDTSLFSGFSAGHGGLSTPIAARADGPGAHLASQCVS